MVGYRGCNIGDQLKSESLWNGTNQSDMNMLPGGGTVLENSFSLKSAVGFGQAQKPLNKQRGSVSLSPIKMASIAHTGIRIRKGANQSAA